MRCICLDCYNKENQEKRTKEMVELSKDKYVCQSCGKENRIVVKVKEEYIKWGEYYIKLTQ